MNHTTQTTSLRQASLIAGLALLIMAIAAPFAELFVYPRLVIPGHAAETVNNLVANERLFVAALFAYLVTFICDVVAAWALTSLLRPVNGPLAQLTGWFRLVYAVIAVVALIHLVTVWQLLTTPDYLAVLEPGQLVAQVRLSLGAFKNGWSFGIVFFGIHLVLLGWLVLRSSYVPKILGLLLIVGGLGYLVTTVGPFWFPNADLHVARYTFVGELIFMAWLLVGGSRIKDSSVRRDTSTEALHAEAAA